MQRMTDSATVTHMVCITHSSSMDINIDFCFQVMQFVFGQCRLHKKVCICWPRIWEYSFLQASAVKPMDCFRFYSHAGKMMPFFRQVYIWYLDAVYSPCWWTLWMHWKIWRTTVGRGNHDTCLTVMDNLKRTCLVHWCSQEHARSQKGNISRTLHEKIQGARLLPHQVALFFGNQTVHLGMW